MPGKIVVIEPLPFWGVAHSETCYRICAPWRGSGAAVSVYTEVAARPDPARILHSSIPALLPSSIKARLHRRYGPVARHLAEERAIKALDPGDVLYAWPTTSLSTLQRARDAGAFVVVEFINSHVAFAKQVIDRERQRHGFPPSQLGQDDILHDDQRVVLADAIFAPGPLVAPSILARQPDSARKLIETSYGCTLPKDQPARPRRKHASTFLFVGSLGLRKGGYTLLAAWAKAGLDADLLIAGGIEEEFKSILQTLNPPRLHLLGFRRDIETVYANADVFVFPSLEEGGPQVTYEAAAHGLPLIVTKAGGGRIANPQIAVTVPDGDVDALALAMAQLAADPDLRHAMGSATRAAASHYTWDKVSLSRLTALKTAQATS